jgi:hypothetical protein
MYNEINEDLGSSICLYADIETISERKLYRFKHVRIYIYSYASFQTENPDNPNKPLIFYRFVARAKFDFDERFFTISTEMHESAIGDRLKYEDHHFLIGHTWKLWENFSKKSVMANIESSVLNTTESPVELNPDGTRYDINAEHPNNGIIYGTVYEYDAFFYVITMKQHPDVGFMWTSDRSHDEDPCVYYHDEDDIHATSIDIPVSAYDIQGPMLKEKAIKMSRNLKKITHPSIKSLYEITHFIELVKEKKEELAKAPTTESRKVIEDRLKDQAKNEAVEYLSNVDGNNFYVQGLGDK